MATMDDVLARLLAVAPSVLADEPVVAAYLFGSHARGEADHLSDVDVALLAPDVAPRDRLDLRLRVMGELSHALEGEVDVIVLDESPLTLSGRVIHDGAVVYSANEQRRAQYESRTFREFVDFSLLGDKLAAEVLRQTAAGLR